MEGGSRRWRDHRGFGHFRDVGCVNLFQKRTSQFKARVTRALAVAQDLDTHK